MDYLFKVRKVSVRTILNYKSAISFYWKAEVGYEVPENDTVVTDLVRSFKRERLVQSKHVVEWDVHLVLEFFRSGRFQHWDSLSDKDLTLKTIFLLALATGKRRSEIHALSKDVRWLNGDVRSVEISPVPEFLSKTHMITNGLGALKPITLSSLDEVSGFRGQRRNVSCARSAPSNTTWSGRRSTGRRSRKDCSSHTVGEQWGTSRDRRSHATSRKRWY